MIQISDKFEEIYRRLEGRGCDEYPLRITTQNDAIGNFYDVSAAVTAGEHIDPLRRPSSRAIGYLLFRRELTAPNQLNESGVRIYVIGDEEGKVTVRMGGFESELDETSHMVPVIPGTMYDVIPEIEALAYDSVLMSIEQALAG